MSDRPHVVVGCGCGGIEAARTLSKAGVGIMLVGRTDRPLFQPFQPLPCQVELAVPGPGAPCLSGLPAWSFRRFAHIYLLIGVRNRLIVMVDGARAYFTYELTYERSARVVAEPAPPQTRRRF